MSAYHDHLSTRGIEIQHEVIFSDGCSCQFKSKFPFAYVSDPQCGHSYQREFFGSGHGKSSCDALGGLVKRKAISNIAAGNVVIRDSKDLFSFAKDKLTQNYECTGTEGSQHKSRIFIYIENITRPSEPLKLDPVPFTRLLHSVRAGDQKGIVRYRNNSCFCEGCDEGQECSNAYSGRF
jgi:hypothetical protein